MVPLEKLINVKMSPNTNRNVISDGKQQINVLMRQDASPLIGSNGNELEFEQRRLATLASYSVIPAKATGFKGHLI